MKRMVGFEAEYLVIGLDGKAVFPSGECDAYPLLGECRGEPSEDAVMAAASLLAKIEQKKELPESQRLFLGEFAVDLDTHREALRRVSEGHNKQIELDKCRNIYGKRVDDVDVISGRGAMRRAIITTGLHVHFSCEEKQEVAVQEEELVDVVLPISVGNVPTNLHLSRRLGYKTGKTLTARASLITLPVVKELVLLLDDIERTRGFFNEKSRYRRGGFWEPKPWGFEYRSFPADVSTLTMEFLTMVGKIGLDYLKGIEISCS